MKSRNRTIIIGTGIVVAALATGLAFQSRRMDDATMKSILVGRWLADDVSNGALNHGKKGIETEEVVFGADGSLLYRVKIKAGQGDSSEEKYTWDIGKGKLRLRDVGEGSTGEALPSLPIDVRAEQISIRRKGYGEKVFRRIRGDQPSA